MFLKKGYRPLYLDNDLLYASRNNKLYSSKDYGVSFEFESKYAANFLESNFPFYNRVARGGIHYLEKLRNGDFVGIKRKAVFYFSKKEKTISEVFRIPRGSRPLNLLCNPVSGKIYFGEYFSNPDRTAVHIYGSENGKDWSIVYTFPAKSIRHIHGLFFDPFKKGVWILTGDDDHESHLWFTSDDFATVKSVKGNSQKTRAVSVIPLKDGLLVPTDTPREKNKILFLNNQNQLEELHDLPGSAFYAHQALNCYLISTVAEPSTINKVDFATIYASKNVKGWKRLVSWKQDIWSGISYKFFRYPEIIFPNGINKTPYIFGYAQAVKQYGGHLFRFNKEDFTKTIKEL